MEDFFFFLLSLILLGVVWWFVYTIFEDLRMANYLETRLYSFPEWLPPLMGLLGVIAIILLYGMYRLLVWLL